MYPPAPQAFLLGLTWLLRPACCGLLGLIKHVRRNSEKKNGAAARGSGGNGGSSSGSSGSGNGGAPLVPRVPRPPITTSVRTRPVDFVVWERRRPPPLSDSLSVMSLMRTGKMEEIE